MSEEAKDTRARNDAFDAWAAKVPGREVLGDVFVAGWDAAQAQPKPAPPEPEWWWPKFHGEDMTDDHPVALLIADWLRLKRLAGELPEEAE